MVFILPSTISNKQSDLLAKNLLWVANIIILSGFICFFKSSKIPFAVSISKLPVGSWASIISGLFIKALAIATLCFWPPDSLPPLIPHSESNPAGKPISLRPISLVSILPWIA